MKKAPSHFRKFSALGHLGNRRGIALISVLAILILLSVLVVAFLMRAEVARTSSANYRATTGTRLLADTVVNLVQAEINDATTYGSSGASGTGPFTWASQPGAIRVYDSSGSGSGATLGLKQIYRLYSAPALTTSAITDLIDTTTGVTKEVPSTWASFPAQWVDLNASVAVKDPATGSNFTVYPIIDNRNPGNTAQCLPLPGFYVNDITSATAPATATSATNVVTLTPTTLKPPVMPVQWLYVLQNGQIVAPTGNSGNSTATFTAPNAPSSTNPIVGRVAYWTDDETCKVNINTAGGSMAFLKDSAAPTPHNVLMPAAWDTPRYGGCWDDIKLLAENQPVQGEYQRYPGHPATTLLFPIFSALSNNNAASTLFYMPEVNTTAAGAYAKGYTSTASIMYGGTLQWNNTSSLFGLLPRYNDDGGSQNGLANTTGTPISTSASPTSNIPPTTKRNRLYTSLGELLYSTTSTAAAPPVRNNNGIQTEYISGTSGFGSPYLNRQQLESGKFLLTAHSRAPEVTLFGTPRVAMWPIPDPSKQSGEGISMAQTPFDQLIAFCSTTNTGQGGTPSKYYFQRYDHVSTTNDWTNESRNQDLYGYLQDLTSVNIPGYANGTFVSKYAGSIYKPTIANERDQILTEMVDYIRCTNLNDHSGTISSTTTYCGGSGNPAEVMPLTITSLGSGTRTTSTTTGLGRLITLSEVGLHIVCTADGTNNLATVNGSNANTGFLVTTITGSSVGYNSPQAITLGGTTVPVSPVIGSASDPAYVSNLPASQFLRDTSNAIVDKYGVTVTAANATTATPFPPNPTLSTQSTNGVVGSYPTVLDATQLAALPVGSKKLQAMVVFELASPMLGFDSMIYPSANIHVTGLSNLQIAGSNPFPVGSPSTSSVGPNINGDGYLNGTGSGSGSLVYQWTRINQMNCVGGTMGFRFPLFVQTTSPTGNVSGGILTQTGTATTLARTNGWSGKGPLYGRSTLNGTDTLGTTSDTQFVSSTGVRPYRFVSNPFTVNTSTITVGGSGSFNVAMEIPVVKAGNTTSTPYQTFKVAFPSSPALNPTLCAYGVSYNTGGGAPLIFTSHAPDWWGFDNRIGWCDKSTTPFGITTTTPNIGIGCVIRGDLPTPSGGWGNATNPWSWKNSVATISTTAGGYTGTSTGTPTTGTYGDVIRSVVPKDGDYRLTMARPSPTTDQSVSNPDFMPTPLYSSAANLSNMLVEQGAAAATPGTDVRGSLISISGSLVSYAPSYSPKVPVSFTAVNGFTSNPTQTYDWDSGSWNFADGAYANKPDEGNTYAPSAGSGTTNIPYQNGDNQVTNSLNSYFTANRMVCSPVTFGSLPTGVAEGIPWRTLLFRPQANRATYTGLANDPKDYLLLDLFNMPVVQPYAISEPFSTAGKINMNYQILPFTYILRDTGVRAVIGSELVARMPSTMAINPSNNGAPYYKGGGINSGQLTTQGSMLTSQTIPAGTTAYPNRLSLNLDETNGTLRQFQDRFKSGDVFRSPAEICDIYLVPSETAVTATNTAYKAWVTSGVAPSGSSLNWSYAAADNGWYGADFGMVGDNVREHPYGDIYARLTTKSNTYTVYYKVQTLKNPPAANQTQWTEGTGVVTGEYRGSTTIERYLDPNNNTIPDFTNSVKNPAITTTALSLDNYYQWRTVANTAFAP